MHGAAACVPGTPLRLSRRCAFTLQGGITLQGGRLILQLITCLGSSFALCLLPPGLLPPGLFKESCILLYIRLS